MAPSDSNDSNDFCTRLALIQKRLKEERLFVRQERDVMRTLNESLSNQSKELFHLSWSTQQHWKNLDRLVLGSRVFPSECSKTAKLIEDVTFEDGSKCLGYQEMRYGEFLNCLRRNPKLVGRILMRADQSKIETSLVVRLLLSSLYGSCQFKEEERSVLTVLKFLVDEQVVPSEDPLGFFCSPKSNAFSVVLKLFSSLLFSAKLYQTAALHGAVMQVIVEDNFYLDLEVNKMLSRFPPKAIRHKFGEPGSPKGVKNIADFMDTLLQFLVNLCKKFLKSLTDKIYCFPPNLRWLIGELYRGLMSKPSANEVKIKAIIGHLLINYFVCPAILNPEPYGINTDATVTEIARYNLSQIASILSALALGECGLKDPKMFKITEKFTPGIISSYVDAILKESQDLHLLKDKEPIHAIHRSAVLITERELKSLISFLKLIHKEKDPALEEAGLSELLSILPPQPRSWSSSQQRDVKALTSFPSEMQSFSLKKHKKLTVNKKRNTMHTIGTTKDLLVVKDEYATLGKLDEDSPYNPEDDLENLTKDLAAVLGEDENVLVISLGNVTGEDVGMLPEEKVLGLTHAVPTATTFDIERTEEDKRKRASTLMLDALKDLGEGFLGSEGELEKIKTIVNRIEDQTSEDSDVAGSLNEKEFQIGADNNNDSLLIDLGGTEIIKSVPQISEKIQLDAWGFPVVTNHNNIAEKKDEVGVTTDANHRQFFDELDSSMNKSLPVSDSSVHFPFVDSFCPLNSTMSPVNTSDNERSALSELIDLEFTDQRNGKGGSSISSTNRTSSEASDYAKSVFRKDKRLSEVSVESVLGNINVVLQGAGIQHSSIQEVDSIHDISESSEALGELNENRYSYETRERAITDDSVTSEDYTIDPWHSSDGPEAHDNVFAVSQSSIPDNFKDLFKEVGNFGRSATDTTEIINRRKKSSGLRFKDKIVSGFRQARSKSDGHHLKKEGKWFGPKMTETQPGEEKPIIDDEDSGEREASLTGRTPKDISEDILQKYRRLAPKTAGFMEDDDSLQRQDEEPVAFAETDWDDNFKFEDAKRKLRIVLCIADRSHFPCDSSNFWQLLTTFLQSQLAEAINLQDRSFVAQLHETLRSIRQLPKESCAKLLDALEEDYKQRSPYITYLIRSKQHLLSAISHLEQMARKVERDKNICSKYFTTVCIRLFLETPEKRRELSAFSLKFEATNMLDEKCALVEEFLEKLYTEMTRDPTWISASDEQWDDCKVATERSLMSIIYKDAFYPNGETDIQNDRIFHEHISRLTKFVNVNHKSLQIPKVYQKEAPWPSAQTELLMINAYKTPVDKLKCIHRCCVTIMNLLSMASDETAPGADDFVPVLVYVVIRANPPNLLSTKQYVNNFYEKRLSGEEYYCWMQFCAAVEFIKSLDNR